MGADGSSTARVQRRLVYLVYLVYLVCLVGRTGNSSRRTRQTRKTSQPDRRTRARCASTEDHQAPSPSLFHEQGRHLAAPLLLLRRAICAAASSTAPLIFTFMKICGGGECSLEERPQDFTLRSWASSSAMRCFNGSTCSSTSSAE